jgi:hypothetical protein
MLDGLLNAIDSFAEDTVFHFHFSFRKFLIWAVQIIYLELPSLDIAGARLQKGHG